MSRSRMVVVDRRTLSASDRAVLIEVLDGPALLASEAAPPSNGVIAGVATFAVAAGCSMFGPVPACFFAEATNGAIVSSGVALGVGPRARDRTSRDVAGRKSIRVTERFFGRPWTHDRANAAHARYVGKIRDRIDTHAEEPFRTELLAMPPSGLEDGRSRLDWPIMDCDPRPLVERLRDERRGDPMRSLTAWDWSPPIAERYGAFPLVPLRDLAGEIGPGPSPTSDTSASWGRSIQSWIQIRARRDGTSARASPWA